MVDVYDRDRSTGIEMNEASLMLEDAYRGLYKDYQPTKEEIRGFFKVMDADGDGRITQDDFRRKIA